MGIKGLRDYIKKNYPQALEQTTWETFKGKRIAIDVYNWIYRNIHAPFHELIMQADLDEEMHPKFDTTALISRLLQMFFRFIFTLMEYSIMPVLIFDGEHPPEKQCKYDRESKRRKADDESLENYRKIVLADKFNQEILAAYRTKLANRIKLEGSEIQTLYTFIQELGLPYFIAKGEAEQLASTLTIEGWVEAAYSTDSDVHAFGCSFAIYGVDKKTKMLKVSRLPVILWNLGVQVGEVWHPMPFQTFVDLCILSETDFNFNIKGFATASACKKLKDAGVIEKIAFTEKQKLEIDKLNYVRCREIFKYVPCKDQIKEGSIDLREPSDSIREYTTLYDLSGMLERFFELRPRIAIPYEQLPMKIPGQF